MDYEKTLEYIHSLLRFGIKPGLERVGALLEALGRPDRALKFIHVAGTNGKGSTCAMTALALQRSGFKTGLYTSPYVTDFRERIQINGEMIGRDDLCRCAERVKTTAVSIGAEPTEFEFITALALLYFSEQKCDIVVLETGRGGRFDATNIIETPLVSVITPIGLDHTAILGDTVEKIAFEKAGIIKPGGRTVLAYGQPDGVVRVIRAAAEKAGNVLTVPETGDVKMTRSDLSGTDFSYRGAAYHVGMIGEHQVQNAVTAAEALNALPFGIPASAVDAALREAFMPARLEMIRRSPLLLLDGGHNLHAARALKKALGGMKLTAIVGMMADKDVDGYAAELAPVLKRVITVEVKGNPRSMTAKALAEVFGTYVPDTSPAAGYAEALTAADDGSGLLVCGSLYLAGEIRPLLKKL